MGLMSSREPLLVKKEILSPPRSLAEKTYSDIRRWTVMEKGGHFAALEQPRVLAAEIIRFFT